MLGKRLIKTSAGAACTTDTVQILDGSPFQSIATYQLDGDANDLTGNYNGTASNVTYSTGKFGQAGVFNGSSSYIDINYRLAANPSYSMSCWFNTSSTSQMAIYSDVDSNADSHTARIALRLMSSGNFGLLMGDGSSSWYNESTSSSSYLDGNWHHIVQVVNGTSIKLYVDGNTTPIADLTSTVSAGTVGERSIIFGRLGHFNGQYFNGTIDQVRIYNKAISAADVTTLYNETAATASTNITLEAPSLVAYYKMNDATDETGSYDGTPTNVNFNVAGKFGNAGDFNGTSSKINTGYIQTGQVYSASFWGKGFSAGGSILRDTPAAGGANTFMDIATGANGQPVLAGNAALDPLNTPSADWTHYVFVLDGTNATIYENGSQTATRTYTAKTGNNGTPVHIMSNGAYPAGFASGSIDQIRIFDRARDHCYKRGVTCYSYQNPNQILGWL